MLELNASGISLISIALLLITGLVELLDVLVTVKTNLVPGKLKELVHVLKAATASLGNGEVDPETTDKGNGGEAPEGTLGGDTTLGNGEQHVGDGAGVTVLVGKVKSHGPRGGESSDTEGEEFGGEEVLHGVPAESPTETRDVDHGDGTARSTLVGGGELKVLIDTELGNLGEERGDVDHGNGLQSDTDKKSALSADDINEEESANNSGDELDDTEDGSDEKTLLLTDNAHNLEQIGGVEGDGSSAGPLGEELNHGGHVETVQVAGDKEQLLDLAEETNTLCGLELVVESSLNLGDLADNIVALGGLLAETAEDLGGLFGLALLDEVAGGLGLEEHEDEDDSGHHDVQTCGDEPLVVSVVGHVEVGAVVCEVSEDDTDVDSTLFLLDIVVRSEGG